eukprot:4683451-Prymnesium_polylepis.1
MLALLPDRRRRQHAKGGIRRREHQGRSSSIARCERSSHTTLAAAPTPLSSKKGVSPRKGASDNSL